MRTPAHSVSIVRTVDAPAAAIYAAWTEPARMRNWMGTTVEADVRVGGRYRIEHDAGNGVRFVHTGEYLMLEPGLRVVQSFLAGPADRLPETPNPHIDEFIALKLTPVTPTRTEIMFTNGWDGQGLASDAMEATRSAWSQWLDQMVLQALTSN